MISRLYRNKKNVSTFIDQNIFNHYIFLLNYADKRQKKEALQDLYFALSQGKILHPNQWEQMIQLLVNSILFSNDDALRRWAYMVGWFSVNNNALLVDCCKSYFSVETCRQNLMWMMPIFSKNLSDREFKEIISQDNHDLTGDNINLSIYLFSRDSIKIGFYDILKKSDPISLMMLGFIGGSESIAIQNRKDPFITNYELSILASETDDDEALKRVMYGFLRRRSFSINELSFPPHAYVNMGNEHKKWYFTLIWKDKSFISNNIDFVQELISDRHLFNDITPEVRIGLARGISDSKYIPEVSSYIIDWYTHEDSPSVLYNLLKYFKNHQSHNKTFKEIVEYQKVNGNNTLKSLLLIDDTQCVYDNNNETQLLNNERLLNMFVGNSIHITKTEEDNKMKVNIKHANQVNNFDGSDNQAVYLQSAQNMDLLKSDLYKSLQISSKDEKAELEKALEAVEKNDESKLKIALKKIVDMGSNIFSNVAADYIVAYMRANGIM